MDELKKRKTIRLTNYDYSLPGVYFVTICTKNKQKLLSTIVGEGLCALPQVHLTEIGKTVKESLEYIHENISGVFVDQYVIMPNHVHLLLRIEKLFETGGHRGPPLHKIIGQFKSFTTHQCNQVIWQRSFHDHVVRGEEDYREIWTYIVENPVRWRADVLYMDE